jgi:hypothetical protein
MAHQQVYIKLQVHIDTMEVLIECTLALYFLSSFSTLSVGEDSVSADDPPLSIGQRTYWDTLVRVVAELLALLEQSPPSITSGTRLLCTEHAQ